MRGSRVLPLRADPCRRGSGGSSRAARRCHAGQDEVDAGEELGAIVVRTHLLRHRARERVLLGVEFCPLRREAPLFATCHWMAPCPVASRVASARNVSPASPSASSRSIATSTIRSRVSASTRRPAGRCRSRAGGVRAGPLSPERTVRRRLRPEPHGPLRRGHPRRPAQAVYRPGADRVGGRTALSSRGCTPGPGRRG